MSNTVVPFSISGEERKEQNGGRSGDKALPEDSRRVVSRGYIEVFQKGKKIAIKPCFI